MFILEIVCIIVRLAVSTATHGVYFTNLDQRKSVESNWITLYVNNNTGTYFDHFRVQYSPKEIKIFKENKNITTNICKIQVYD